MGVYAHFSSSSTIISHHIQSQFININSNTRMHIHLRHAQIKFINHILELVLLFPFLHSFNHHCLSFSCFPSNSIQSDGYRAISEGLKMNSSLLTLNMSSAFTFSFDCLFIISFISTDNPGRNYSEGWNYLNEALCVNSTLTSLDVSMTFILFIVFHFKSFHILHQWNSIGYFGVLPSFSFMKTNSSLTSLNISGISLWI